MSGAATPLAARRASDGRIDLRKWGSRNPGAMNAMRTFGPAVGIAVAVADAGKGFVACAVGRALGDDRVHVAGVASVVGHCHPRGRRGARAWRRVRASAVVMARFWDSSRNGRPDDEA